MGGGIEWLATCSGLTGAFLLASHTRISSYGWLLLGAANVGMMALAFQIDHYGLLLQQLGLFVSSVVGMHRAGLLRQRMSRSTHRSKQVPSPTDTTSS
jgi:nicotinamide riboside transporter PnuC